jgi:hypothetical protein
LKDYYYYYYYYYYYSILNFCFIRLITKSLSLFATGLEVLFFLFVRDGLSLGGSRHWRDALYVMTDEKEMNGSALLEYFQPLYEFLQQENSINTNSASSPSSEGQTVPIVVGAVLLAIVVVVIIGYVIFRRRAAKRNETA